MRLELAERLRCPQPHPPSPLVVVARETVERDLRRGRVGCPVCYGEAEIAAGDVCFASAPAPQVVPRVDDDDAVDRLMALLGLAEPGGSVLVSGEYAAFAARLAARAEVAVITWNARTEPTADVSAVVVAGFSVPFTDHTFRGAALSATTPYETILDAVRTVMPGGRLVGALSLAVPPGVQELARDAREWVGERVVGAEGIVRIRRA